MQSSRSFEQKGNKNYMKVTTIMLDIALPSVDVIQHFVVLCKLR